MPSLRREPQPVRVARALCPREDTLKFVLNETVELLTKVLGTSEEDPNLSALSAPLKAKLGLADLKKPLPTTSEWKC